MLETRRARRYRCQETLDIETSGRVRMVLLKDLSLSGARLSGQNLPEVGSLVRLTPTFGERLKQWVFAQICWIRRGELDEAGLRFLEPPSRLQQGWVGRTVEGREAWERRRSIRVASEVYVELKLPGERRALEGMSLDLSQGGAQIQVGRPLEEGGLAELFVCLPYCMMEVQAQVVRPAPEADEMHQSLRFLAVDPGDREALDGFLRSQVSGPSSPDTSGQAWLRVLNR